MAAEVIDCGDALGIAELDQLYTRLLKSLADNTPVSFDCSQIERIDAAALQMLFAFSQESAVHGHPIDWTGASETFIKNTRLLGLSEAMGLN